MMAADRDPNDVGTRSRKERSAALGAVLTFEDSAGQQCRIEAWEAAVAFLEMARQGLAPEPGEMWQNAFGDAQNDYVPSAETGLSHYFILEPLPGGKCRSCSAECHAVFKADGNRFLIERWALVTAIMLLVRQEMLPGLPIDWYVSLDVHFRGICVTGQQHYRHRASRGDRDIAPVINPACPECTGAMRLKSIRNPRPWQVPGIESGLQAILGVGHDQLNGEAL